MNKSLRYLGYVILCTMMIGSMLSFADDALNPLLALVLLAIMYLVLMQCWFTIRFLFRFDELKKTYNSRAGERIVPDSRFTWELLSCWHGSTPQATRWRRRYNIRVIFAILFSCTILIYGLMAWFVLGFLGSSSGGSESSEEEKNASGRPRRCTNCYFYSESSGCELASHARGAFVGESCSKWTPHSR